MDAVDFFLSQMVIEAGGRPMGIRDLDPKAKAKYMREAKARSRARQREARAAAAFGEPLKTALPSTDEVREAMADAALLLLAVDGPGADQIRAVIAKAFLGKSGLPSLVTAKAKDGRMSTRSPRLRIDALKRAANAS